MQYDYLVIGSGLFGSVFGREMAERGCKVLMIEKGDRVGGMCWSEKIEGVDVHVTGPHIFHTNDEKVWTYVNKFASFNNYVHRPKARYRDEIYSLPFNLMTFYQMWGCKTPAEARAEMDRQRVNIPNPKNLEEWALSQVGGEIYDKIIYGYTKKQWQREPRDLPASILKRIPVRFTYDDNYFNDRYQGIPERGYAEMVGNIVGGLEIVLGEDFFDIPDWKRMASKLVYSGPIDQFYGYEFGELEYRTLEFRHEVVTGDFQGTAIVNYTHPDVKHTRITEHKHFLDPGAESSVITYEYPVEWKQGMKPYYPVNDDKNNSLHKRYMDKAKEDPDLIVGGRLGLFRYFDMDMTISNALVAARKEP